MRAHPDGWEGRSVAREERPHLAHLSVVDVDHDVVSLVEPVEPDQLEPDEGPPDALGPGQLALPTEEARPEPEEPSAPLVADRIPEGSAWRYEPDWDGLRVIAARIDDTVRLISEGGRSLDRFFPEVVRNLQKLPLGNVAVRGSLVVVRPEGCSYDLLRRRIHPAATRVTEAAAAWPATIVLTDVVSDRGRDLRGAPLTLRRTTLVTIAERAGIASASATLRRVPSGAPVVLSPQTPFVSFAQQWLDDRDEMGRDGVIARHEDGLHVVRVRRLRRAACVVTAIRTSGSGKPHALRLGMYEGGTLIDVGRTASIRRGADRREAEEIVSGLAIQGRTTDGRWTLIDPRAVCEVRYERLRGRRFRHPAAFLRWLPEEDPSRCSIDQLDVPLSRPWR
jgi:ATP-dependent DNA ligase